MVPALIILGVIVFIVIVIATMYNGLVRLRNQVKNAWAQIDVQLKRRHDLIPNIVETAKGYMKHERETLEAVTQARAAAQKATTPGEASKAEQTLSNALGQFSLVVERYPDLKASQNFMSLQEELASTENRIAFARQFYNDQVMIYNTRIQSVPANMIAGAFNFKEMEMFELEIAAERAVPEVKF